MNHKSTIAQTQALLVDMQTRLMPAMPHRTSVTLRSVFLLKALRILGIPVTVSEQYTRGLGETEPVLMETGACSQPMEKITFSCMSDSKLKQCLLEGPPTVLVWGVEAHICVCRTVLDLIDHGKKVLVVCDCTDSRNPYDREIAFRRMEQAGAIMCTSEMIVYELMEQAGTEEFRAISALVKATPLFEN